MPSNLEDRLKEVVCRDGRYHVNAYRFVYEALDYTVKQLEKKRHISGRELFGAVDLSLDLLPSYVTGTITGPHPKQQDLAVAVNGTIEAADSLRAQTPRVNRW